jgi:ABC-type glycerol-3-phosphate transport system substrate-binding protein
MKRMGLTIRRILIMMVSVSMLLISVACRTDKQSSNSGDETSSTTFENSDFTDSTTDGTEVDSGDSSNQQTTSGNKTNSGKTTTTVKKENSTTEPVTISVGISNHESPEFNYIIPVFKKKYPNINVDIQILHSSLYQITPKWTALAAAGKLPDVVIGSENFGYIIQQGWAYPLDNLLAADTDKDDVFEVGLGRYTYNGHLFALPFRLQFNTIFVNLDLLETLNLKKPAYNWTISEFISLAKAASTTQYSGINYIYNSTNPQYGLDNKLMCAMLPSGYDQYGYNMSKHTFNLRANNAWVNSIKAIQDLRSNKHTVSDELKDPSKQIDDYDRKFGVDADAFVSGKVLFGNHNTWEFGWWKSKLGFKGDIYPVPTQDGIKQRIQTHVDFVFISSAVNEKKYKQAYQLARFLSYDKDGCLARLEYSVNKSEAEYGSFVLYLPATENKTVISKFNSYSVFPDGLKYMLNQVVQNPQQTLVADCDKVVPDFWNNVVQYREQAEEKISKGTDPSSLVVDLENKINKAMEKTWDYLTNKVKKNLENFYKNHPYEKKIN